MSTTCTIFASDTTWSLAITGAGKTTHIDLPLTADTGALAESINSAVRIFHPRHFLLALPSHWCLSATLSSANLPRRDRHSALCYRLEERVPLPVEEFTADFLIGREQMLAVCVATSRLAPFIAAFDANNITIDVIIPAALLAAPAEQNSHVLLCSAESIDLVQYQDNLPIRWYTYPNTARDLAIHLKVLSLTEHQGSRIENDRDNAAARAHEILSRNCAAPLDLRRDQLASSRRSPQRRQLIAVAASLVFFLLCLNIALLYRASAYASVARDQQSLQQTIFRETLPAQSIPADIESRLASEERRVHLAGIPGDFSSRSALLTLRDALTHLPTDVRYRLSDIQLTGADITLTGQSRTHADADRLAMSLRAIPAFDIPPPRTEQSADNLINFTITGKVGNAQ
jgi:hypothetical protein